MEKPEDPRVVEERERQNHHPHHVWERVTKSFSKSISRLTHRASASHHDSHHDSHHEGDCHADDAHASATTEETSHKRKDHHVEFKGHRVSFAETQQHPLAV